MSIILGIDEKTRRQNLSDKRAIARPFVGEARQHPDDPNVWVTEYGEVWKRTNRSHPERTQWKQRKLEVDTDGYLRASIKGRHYHIHRLVYQLFIGSLADGLVICHKNGKRDDNRAQNLLQATQAENISHKRLHGTWQLGSRHPRALITEGDALAVKKLLSDAKRSPNGRISRGEHIKISIKTGVSLHIVRDIYSKGAWSHVHYSGM